MITCVYLDVQFIHILLKMSVRNLMVKLENVFLLGYGNETKGYRLYDLAQSRIIHSKDLCFNEYVRGFEAKRSEEVEQHEVSLHESDKKDSVNEQPAEANELVEPEPCESVEREPEPEP